MYLLNTSITYGTSILTMTINIVICMLFNYSVEYEKHHTTNDLTSAQFYRILIFSTINVGFVVLLVNFDVYKEAGTKFLGFIPILNG